MNVLIYQLRDPPKKVIVDWAANRVLTWRSRALVIAVHNHYYHSIKPLFWFVFKWWRLNIEKL